MGPAHLSRNRQSDNRWNEKDRAFAMGLFQGDFADFGPTMAAQKLNELNAIKVSKETLRRSMIVEGVGAERSVK